MKFCILTYSSLSSKGITLKNFSYTCVNDVLQNTPLNPLLIEGKPNFPLNKSLCRTCFGRGKGVFNITDLTHF